MSRFYPNAYKPFSKGIKVKVDLSNYAKKKIALKNVTHVDTSSFA